MKITRSCKDAQRLKLAKEKANEGCDKCPSCGELRRSSLHYYKSKGIFLIKVCKVDVYKCYNCDTQWESEPYEVE